MLNVEMARGCDGDVCQHRREPCMMRAPVPRARREDESSSSESVSRCTASGKTVVKYFIHERDQKVINVCSKYHAPDHENRRLMYKRAIREKVNIT